jgi:hypothetical protein
MRSLVTILALTITVTVACAQEPQPDPDPAPRPTIRAEIPGEPVLAIPGVEQAPPPPPEFAPPVGDAGADTGAPERELQEK